ncbi:AAA domain-containing protein [Sinomonas sp. JGH33]|uniref:AAA domain-containing protein n=1 Tax=Sinomonas terricola TaxID=3110330 RepID=A0ABU5TAM1_9MICC|nr:AAA domain-containing protein [Sinomonas sp. JGH33]MEA5456737.1 AAA domain-containing protein [Sinomonas sp. JGH33]
MPDVVGDHFMLLNVVERRGGTFSVVRKAVDDRDGSFVAVKLLLSGHSDDVTRKVFNNEAKTLKSLSHPHIVRCRWAGTDESENYVLVLDWVERNLDDLLKVSGPWESWDRLAADIALPLVDALAYTHLKQIEHRDIKPQNVLVTDAGVPLLADFGIAKIRGEEQTTLQTVAGWHSKPYAPPELNADVRYVRDVYSMGVLLIQCMTKEQLKDLAGVERALESIPVPPDVRRLLGSCIATQADDRPKNASDLLSALKAIQQRRQAQQQVARNPIWLRLTRSAIRSLGGSDDSRREAIGKIQADLSGDVYASFFNDQASGQLQRDSIRVDGSAWSFTLKSDESGATVIRAAELDFERLENHRRRALLLPQVFDWTFAQPANPALALAGVATLIDAIDAFYEAKNQAEEAGEDERDGDELFDTWRRVLNAREELARGEKKPLPYKKVQARGREATFTLESAVDHDLVGTEWRVRDQVTDRKFAWGEVIDHDVDRVVILSARRWEGLPDRAVLDPHLGPDEAALNRQRQAVDDVQRDKSARPDLRELLLDPGRNTEPKAISISKWNRELDDRKREAIETALGSPDIYVVQGPPGTGKTSFIAELVEQTLSADPEARVLIASQTNVAVDNALQRLADGGQAGMVRLASADPNRVDESVRHLLLDAQMKRWAREVRKNAESHMGARATEAGLAPSHLRAALALQQLSATLSQLDYLQTVRPEDEDEQRSDLATSLTESTISTSVQEKVDSLADWRDELLAEAQSELGSDLTLSADMSARDALNAVEALIGESADAQQLLTRLRLQGEWLQRISSDAGLANTFLDQTSVIAGTCVGYLRHPAVRHLEIDLCIVDEASRATLTEALVPVSQAKRWVVVGDTNQLPPIDEELLRNKELMSDHQLHPGDVKETLFQRLTDRLPEHSQVMLNQQYRMIRPIGDMISTCFYGEELRSPNDGGLEGYPLGYGKPVLWLDTSAHGEDRREAAPHGKGKSFANRAEARIVIDRLKVLNGSIDKEVVQLPKSSEQLDVLVIAPYVAQVADLKQQLAPLRDRLRHLSITVMSVDAVQGRESDVAIFSVTRSNARAELGFIGPDYWRRINVALSRARFGLTIVGDAGFIRGTTGALKKVLTYIDTHPDDCELRTAER